MVSNKKAVRDWQQKKPLMILKQDKDSIYVRADTLYQKKYWFTPDKWLIALGLGIGPAYSTLSTLVQEWIRYFFLIQGVRPEYIESLSCFRIIRVFLLQSPYLLFIGHHAVCNDNCSLGCNLLKTAFPTAILIPVLSSKINRVGYIDWLLSVIFALFSKPRLMIQRSLKTFFRSYRSATAIAYIGVG